MTETERNPKEILAEIQQGLNAKTASDRQAALGALGALSYSSGAIMHTLEKMALKDRSKVVRDLALDMLNMPIYRQIQAHESKLAEFSRRMILDEIAVWEEQGVLDGTHAKVLRGRYNFDMQPALAEEKSAPPKPEPVKAEIPKPEQPKPKPQPVTQKRRPKPEKPKRTLAQTLFSEASIKVALYLGAFFVIAAAAIFAAVIEALRLPILFFFTLAFGGGALALKKRLPQPSFTLFIIFSVFLPIDATVIADQTNLSGSGAYLYWFLVYLLMTGIWTFATWLYHSRFFSIMAFAALDIASYNLGRTFGTDVEAEAYLLLFSVVSLLALAGSQFLKRWLNEKFSAPLFWLAQAQQITLLFTSFSLVLYHLTFGHIDDRWWLAVTAIWWLGASFYVVSNWLKQTLLFRALAVFSMMPLTWFFLNTFDSSLNAHAIALFIWGALFALSGEAFNTLKGKFHEYGSLLSIGAVPLVGFSVLLSAIENTALSFGLALGVALLYTALSVYRARLWTWAYALIAALSAYAIFFELEFMYDVDFFYGLKILIPSLLLLLPDLFLKNDFKANREWRLPPRFFGIFLVAVNSMSLLAASAANYQNVALVFFFYALLGLGYAFHYAPEFAYATNISLILVVIYVLLDMNSAQWIAPFTTIASLYYLVGFIAARIGRSRWADVFILSGLVLGSLAAVSAPTEGLGFVKSLPVIAMALFFGIEAFRSKSVGLTLPANGFLLMAFVMILIDIEQNSLDMYWIVATVGMLLYYLGGWLLDLTDQAEIGESFRYGGLIAATMASISVVFIEPSLLKIITPILTTAIFTIEAYRSKMIWLSYLANGFLLMAFAVTLGNFEQNSSEFYWLVATGGMLIHYFVGWLLGYADQAEIGESFRYGAVVAALGASISTVGVDPMLTKLVPLVVAAVLFTLEAFYKKFIWFAMAANALFIWALLITLEYFDRPQQAALYYLIAAAGMIVNYLIGWGLERTKTIEVADIYRYGALVTAALLSLMTLNRDVDVLRVIPVAVAAGLFALEAFRKKFVLFAVVANVLYIWALFITLDHFDRHQQVAFYYLVAAAGMLVNYLVGWGFERTKALETADIYRYGALVTATLLSLLTLYRDVDLLRVIPIVFAAGLFTLEAFRKKNLLFTFPSNAFYMLAYFMALYHFNLEGSWVYYLAAIVGMLLHYIVGLSLERTQEPKWADVYRYAALLTATMVAISAPFRDADLIKVLPVVFAAGVFTYEAFHKRSLWLGFPANVLYLMAYFMVLLNFEIEQPQFYTVAAAALGMVMHYLLVRVESKTSAFITGMLSQLVLLSTTYFQLVSEEALGYFVVLFFQALAVLIYGIVIRSRSLLTTPIIFLVLGVLTVTFNLVGSEWSIFLIGCTGVLLIVFAIGALLMRERFASLREKLEDWDA